jgi:hypothetical protein
MPSPFIGRRKAVGFGVEATRGTKVAPTFWFKHLSVDFYKKTKTIQNESAMNRMEKVNDSALVQAWAEGKLDGKVGDIGIGYLLANIFGNKAVATHPAETLVFDHTFTINQTNTPPTHTISIQNPNTGRRHGFGTLKNLEISGDDGDWVKVSADILADQGANNVDTVTYVAENEFTGKHVTVKMAANQAGIGAATAIKAKSFKVTIDRKAEAYWGFSGLDPADFYVGSYEVTGELVLAYADTTYEDLHYNNTIQYLQISIVNTDVTIGTTSNPALVITCPRARIEDWGMSDDLDKVIEQTLSFYMEFDLTSSSAVQAVLTNTKANYTT